MSSVYHDWVPLMFPGDTATTALTAAAADLAVMAVPYKCEVRRVGVLVADTDTDAGDVTFAQRILAGSDTGRVTFATVSKPGSNVQGKYFYEDPAAKVVLNEGDEIVVAATAACGELRAMVLVERIPEVPANQADMVAG